VNNVSTINGPNTRHHTRTTSKQLLKFVIAVSEVKQKTEQHHYIQPEGGSQLGPK